MSPHPSRLALDRYALGLPDAQVLAHAGGCGACSEHLKRVTVELPIPEWVKGLGEKRRPQAQWFRPVLVALSMVAVAVIAVVTPKAPAVREKPTPGILRVIRQRGSGGSASAAPTSRRPSARP